MGSNFEHLFQVLPRETAPSYLCERIEKAVLRERERSERARLVISSLTGTSSLVGLVFFALPALVNPATTAGFNLLFELILTLLLFVVFSISLKNFVHNFS